MNEARDDARPRLLRRCAAAVTVVAVCALAGCSGTAGDGGAVPASASATVSVSGAVSGAGSGGGGGDTAPPRNDVYAFESAQLAGNRLGASNRISMGVLLPRDYEQSDTRYPVVYFLPGFSSYANATAMPEEIGDAADEAGVIVVSIVGANELGGSWYTDSDASGHWESAIVSEIVPFVDATYRTIATREGRGLAGHSMGGYGAFTIGMDHPDVFGSVYVMAPAITGSDGVDVPALFGETSRVSRVLDEIAALEGLDGQELLDAMASSPVNFEFSYGTAAAPTADPPYFRYPYSLVNGEIVRDDEVFALWQAGLGDVDAEIATNRENLLSLDALGLDCGSNDELRWIWEGCGFLDEALTVAGVPHEYTVHDGTHTSRFPERLQEAMVPFFVEAFAGVAAGA